MHCKAILFSDHVRAAKILATHNVRKIKDIGRAVDGYNDAVWMNLRPNFAIRGIHAKFSQNEDLKQQMLSDFRAGNRHFIEAAPDDEQWGVLLDQYSPKLSSHRLWKGTNILGLCLDFVACRIVLEMGQTLERLPLNVKCALQYTAFEAICSTETKQISAIFHALHDNGHAAIMDWDDYMHGGAGLYNTLRWLLGFNENVSNISIQFTKYQPQTYNPNYLKYFR